MLHVWQVGEHASHLAYGGHASRLVGRGTCFMSGVWGACFMSGVWGEHVSHLARGTCFTSDMWDIQQALASSLCPPNYAVTKLSH